MQSSSAPSQWPGTSGSVGHGFGFVPAGLPAGAPTAGPVTRTKFVPKGLPTTLWFVAGSPM